MSGLLEVSQPGPGQPGSSTAPEKDLLPTVSCSSSSVIVGWMRRAAAGSTDVKEAWVRRLLPSGAGQVRGHEQMIDSAGSGALSFLELPDYHVRESGLLGSSYVTRAVWMRKFTFPSVDWQIRTCSFRMRGANVFSNPTFAYIEPSTYVPGGDDITSDAVYPSIGAIADLGGLRCAATPIRMRVGRVIAIAVCWHMSILTRMMLGRDRDCSATKEPECPKEGTRKHRFATESADPRGQQSH